MDSTPTKICKSCKDLKTLDCFGKNKRQNDKRHYYCKECVKKSYELKKEEKREYFKKYRNRNREKLREYHKQYNKNYGVTDDPDDLAKREQRRRTKREQEKERRNDINYRLDRRNYFKHKYKTDQQFKIKKQFESTLNRMIKDGNESPRSMELIGCSITHFKAHLEAKFAPGMCWGNYGVEWNLDRVIPFCDFDLTDEEQRKICFHYSNVQPLFITTKVIDGVEFLGNLNKNKY